MTTADSELRIVRGACGHDCPDTCSWMVEVRNGRAEKLYGDPDHPFTRGTLCAKVNHYLERVYHPDRLEYPLKRVGPKGEGQFIRISWDDALAEISAKWKAIIAESGAEAILPYSSAGNQGLIQHASLDRRLFGLLGCSRLARSICGEVPAAGLSVTQGNGFGVDPEELVHSRYIVLWGTNTIVTNLHLWPVIVEARQRGAKIVVIDPIRTRTAEQADWHIQPRPGSDATLAMAMMHVIIRDNLVDHDYVSRYSIGYEQLVERSRQYAPTTVADRIGLSVETIEKLTHEYAATQPSLLRPLIGLEHHRNGAMTFRAMACLPVLIGSWRHRGGGLSRSTGAVQYSTLNHRSLTMPELERPSLRTLNMRDLGSDLCSATLAPPIRSLCIWNVNPVVSIPDQQRIIRGLLRDDLLTIVHDLTVTETAKYADYVFPATSQIECLDLVPAWGHHYVSLNQPAIAPVGESVSNTEFFRRLAAAMGLTEPYLFESDESLIRTALNSGHPWLEGITFERLREVGSIRLQHDRDWRPFADGRFQTPSGKAELWSQSMLDQGLDPLPSGGDSAQSVHGRLQLISGKTLHYLNSSYGHIERHRRREGTLFIEVHPDDAECRGLLDGELVDVVNEYGRVTAVCRISQRIRPGVVWMPFGGLVDAAGNARSVNSVTPVEPTDWGGGSGFYDAFVEIAKCSLPVNDLSRRPESDEYFEFYNTYIRAVPDGDILQTAISQLSGVSAMLARISEPESTLIHSPYTWTIRQVLGHVIDVERIFADRLHRISSGDPQPQLGMDQDLYVNNQDFSSPQLTELTEEWRMLRQANILLLKRIRPEAWEIRGRASDHPVSVRALAWMLVGHVTHHMNIVSRRLQAPRDRP